MNCREVQSQIIPFIEGKLTDEQNIQFIEHVEHCSECYDDLEVYFIIFAGFRQLDDDDAEYIQNITDFKAALKDYIEYKKSAASRHKSKSIKRRMIAAATVCLFVALTGLSYAAAMNDVSVLQEIKYTALSVVYRTSGEPIKKSVEMTLDYHFEEYSGYPELILNTEVPKDSDDGAEDDGADAVSD